MDGITAKIHYPGCNIWCNERGHYLLPSGPQGEPFSHRDGKPCAMAGS